METTENINTKVKILVVCHAPCQLLKDDVFVPIHVGRAVAESRSKDHTISREEYDWMQENMIGDNGGDNISEQNRYLNELTAIYWAWKNYNRLGDPDYIGFMHYRRHLCFDLNNKEVPDRYGLLYSNKLDKEYIRKYRLNAEYVIPIVTRYDVIVAEKCDLQKLGTKTCYNHYLTAVPNCLHIEDYDKALEIVKEKYPDYKDSITEYNASRYAYFTNIFIMKKELFVKYTEWLFPIIFEAHKHLDIVHYNISEVRANAYISEWLFGIWYTHLKKRQNIKSLELKRTLVRDASIKVQHHIAPAFKTNNIAICLAADEQYLLYLGVAVQSIIQHVDVRNNYDIIILHEQLSIDAQRKILEIRVPNNVSIRFFCVKQYYEKYENIFYECAHISKSTYNRFFLADLCKDYAKILYLDCDLVVNRDVADIFNTPLDERYLIAAVQDFEVNNLASNDKKWGKSYFNEFLHLKDVFHYFQAGVLLFNVTQFRREKIVEKLISTLIRIKKPIFVDQDILNIVCENRVFFLDPRWNVEYHIPIWHPNWMSTMPVSILYDYIASRKNPWILHFAGAKKPWQDASYAMSDYFWRYARCTPFYEEILKEFTEYRIKSVSPPPTPQSADVASTYDFKGDGNKLLLLKDGQYVEQKEKIPGLEIDIQGGNNNTIKLDDVSIILGILRITIHASDCYCHIGKGTKASYPAKIGDLGIYLGCRGARVDIGDHPIISYDVVIHCSEPHCQCQIGNDVNIGENTRIYVGDGHPVIDVVTHKVLNYSAGKRVLKIGDHSWIGQGSFIGKNGSMGEHTIVGAHSVVTKPVKESHCVLAGNPARIVKTGVMRLLLWQEAFKLEREAQKNIEKEASQGRDHQQQEIPTSKEQLSHRDAKGQEENKNPDTKSTTVSLRLLSWFNLQRCRLGSHFLFGKARQHYIKKKRMLRRKIGNVGEQLKP